jgi:hypothetical protein
LSGARQDEDELADALDEIVAQRRADLPREVEMGVDG